MVLTSAPQVALAAACIVIAGCTDLKPIQAHMDDLQSQVSQLQRDMAKASSDAAAAHDTASTAASVASGAQNTANQALATAQSTMDATNEKIDRMFKRTPSKSKGEAGTCSSSRGGNYFGNMNCP